MWISKVLTTSYSPIDGRHQMVCLLIPTCGLSRTPPTPSLAFTSTAIPSSLLRAHPANLFSPGRWASVSSRKPCEYPRFFSRALPHMAIRRIPQILSFQYPRRSLPLLFLDSSSISRFRGHTPAIFTLPLLIPVLIPFLH